MERLVIRIGMVSAEVYEPAFTGRSWPFLRGNSGWRRMDKDSSIIADFLQINNKLLGIVFHLCEENNVII